MLLRARSILTIAALLGLALCGWYFSKLAHYNPFTGFSTGQPNPLGYPISLNQAELSVWQGKTLTTRAQIAAIRIRRDLAVMQAEFITHGVIRYGKNSFAYDAQSGTYNLEQGEVVATGLCRLKNADFDLTSRGFEYNEGNQFLSIPSQVTGNLQGGSLTASMVTYSLTSKILKTGPIHWVGIPQSKAAQVAQETVDSSDKPHRWDITAAQSRGLIKNNHQVRAFLEARATDGRIIVEAPSIEQDVQTDVLTCQGPVRYYSAKVDLVCDKAVIYHREDRAVLTGRVVMYFKPKDAEVLNEQDPVPHFQPLTPEQVDKDHPPVPMVMTPTNKSLADDLRSDKTLREYPSTVFADKIVYYYKKGFRKAVITGHPQAQQELTGGMWRRIWSVTAFYNGETKTLRLAGPTNLQNVRVKDSLGDDFTTDWLETSTVENSGLYATGVMSGKYYMDDKDLNKASDQAGSVDKSSKIQQSDKGKTGTGASGSGSNGSGKSPGAGG